METDSALSFELVCLMEWLLNNNEEKITDLVDFALKNGFTNELNGMNEEKYLQIAQDLPHIILDFMFSLEEALMDGLTGIKLDNKTKEKLIPTLEHIDTNKIAPEVIWLSMQQTKSSLGKNEMQQDPKQILFKKLLKNWEPQQNEPLN